MRMFEFGLSLVRIELTEWSSVACFLAEELDHASSVLEHSSYSYTTVNLMYNLSDLVSCAHLNASQFGPVYLNFKLSNRIDCNSMIARLPINLLYCIVEIMVPILQQAC